MAERGSPGLDTFFGSVTHLGSIALTGPLALLLGLLLAWKKRRAQAWFVAGAFFGAALFAQVGKLLVARPRPEGGTALVEMPSDLSFPSAHTTQATALALAVWLVTAGMPPGKRSAVAIGGAAAVGLVALSRVYLQVHYPSDVVAGMLGATAWVGGLGLATRRRS
jgi:undecaprenyl-diphosphatase